MDVLLSHSFVILITHVCVLVFCSRVRGRPSLLSPPGLQRTPHLLLSGLQAPQPNPGHVPLSAVTHHPNREELVREAQRDTRVVASVTHCKHFVISWKWGKTVLENMFDCYVVTGFTMQLVSGTGWRSPQPCLNTAVYRPSNNVNLLWIYWRKWMSLSYMRTRRDRGRWVWRWTVPVLLGSQVQSVVIWGAWCWGEVHLIGNIWNYR